MRDRLTIQFVRPDRLVYEGDCASVILAAHTGELGIWPGHAPAIVALGDGVVRINALEEDGGATYKVIISGGYAEIADDTVIILADHARRADDIEPEVVQETLDAARAELEALSADDHRSAYYENKMAWCKLLLEHAEDEPFRAETSQR